MATEARIEIRGFDKLAAKLVRIGKGNVLKRAIKQSADHLKGALSEYPPRRRMTRRQVYGRTFESVKQQRYFFWALNAGKIEVPYRRGLSPGSERFGQSWAIEIREGGLTAVIGNDTTYGPMLMDPKGQIRWHKRSGWDTTEKVVERERDIVIKFIKDEIDRALA